MSTDPSYDQTHWAPARRRKPLPAFYYHEHFTEMLEFIVRHYKHVLPDSHRRLIDDFWALPQPVQCLYVRLVNRKGRVFATNKIRYPELGDPQPLLQEMREQGWVDTPGASHYHDVLRYLTKAEISAVLQPIFTGMSRSLKKDDLVSFAREHCSATDFMLRLRTERLLVRCHVDAIRYLLFLYFGKVQDGLSAFTMRDLGLVRTHDFHRDYEPRFNDRAEALEHYYFSVRLHQLHSVMPDGVARLVKEADSWPEPEFSASALIRDKLAYRLGRRTERAGDLASALQLYGIGESAKCSERVIRLLLAAGRRCEAEQHLERCIANPRSEEEGLMAQDIYARKFRKKRTSAVTDELRAANTIDIDEARSGSPERAAIEYYESQGVQAHRTENLLWRTFFGLLFWNELFLDEKATLHSPFDNLPAALVDGSFSARNSEQIEARLAVVKDKKILKQELLKISTQNYGVVNGVFRWRQSIIEALFVLIEHAETESIRQILRRFCENYMQARYGYPDLMVIDDDGARFIEIKTEGDQLRRNQLLRQQQLRDAGFRADVVRIRWVLDPDQVYVVVDVETTGGRGQQHRVTEIGAVKVRGNKVIDRFQTLLNPQRTIPSGITRLTGITPAMVSDAPVFSDIADDFEEFMQDAIFVAHNVDFDYRFIAHEFHRMGRRFRHPKLCTCRAMRKLYPGHQSYSLAALCGTFGIDLRQHHRAMCDAEAAAALLFLINEKRAEDFQVL